MIRQCTFERQPQVVQRAREVGVLVLGRRRERAEQRHGGVIMRDLGSGGCQRVQGDGEGADKRRTRPSERLTKVSMARAAPFATALTRSGSKRAASSSLTIERAVVKPSLAVGTVGGRAEKDGVREDESEKAEVTASVSRFVDRVRYSVSNGWMARSTRTVSGLCCASV